MKRSTHPFSRIALIVLPASAILSIAVAVTLSVTGDTTPKRASAGADGYSRSAIGHRGLVTLLREVGIPVVVSRGQSGSKAKTGLLIVAEPRSEGDANLGRLQTLVRSAPRTLLVLPKWYGFARPGAAWVNKIAPVPTTEVARLVTEVVDDGAVARGPVAGWQAPDDLPLPELARAQTVTSDSLEPVVWTDGGMLVGMTELVQGELWVLADPDVLNNAGLRSAANARFIISLIDSLRDGGPVIFDETVHGYKQSTSLLQLLFELPLALATAQIVLCMLFAIWAALVRFGPRRAPPPPLAPGKEFLIRNTATLLQYGGHHAEALRRYLTATVQHVRHALNAPPGLSDAALVAWLERIRTVRAGTVSLPDLTQAIHSPSLTPQRVLELASSVHRWRMEMMNEPGNRP